MNPKWNLNSDEAMSLPVNLALVPSISDSKNIEGEKEEKKVSKDKILQDKYVNDVYNKIAPHFSNT